MDVDLDKSKINDCQRELLLLELLAKPRLNKSEERSALNTCYNNLKTHVIC